MPSAKGLGWQQPVDLPKKKEVVFECPKCGGVWHARMVGDDVRPLPLQEVVA
jgi:hypothetical protein